MRERQRLADEERDRRRAKDRERLREAAEQLLSSEGWQRTPWLSFRGSSTVPIRSPRIAARHVLPRARSDRR